MLFLDRECPELPQPELGTVTLSGREFGGKATYTCPLGYNVVGVMFGINLNLFYERILNDGIYSFFLACN